MTKPVDPQWPEMRMRKLEHIGFRHWVAWVCDLNGFNDLVTVYGNSRRKVRERCASIIALSGKKGKKK